jgi:hypothetical protein
MYRTVSHAKNSSAPQNSTLPIARPANQPPVETKSEKTA